MSSVPPRLILALIAGFSLWAVAFVALYALQALGCRWGWDGGVLRLVLVAAFAVVLVAQGWIALRLRAGSAGPEPAPFLLRAGYWGSVAAFVSATLVFGPVLFASACI